MKKQTIPPQLKQQIDLQFQTAVQLHQAGKLQQAHQLYQSILKVLPNHAGANQFAGVIAHQSGDNKAAEKLIKKAIKAEPKSAQAHNHLGVVMQTLGKLNDARNNFYKATKLQPKYAEAYVNLGMVYRQLHQLDQAIDTIRKAITLEPNRAGSHNALGLVLRATGKPDEAIESYNTAIELNPKLPEAYNNLGNVYIEQEKDELAIECLDNAIQILPKYADAHFNIGLIYQRSGQLDKAHHHLSTAVEIQPNNLEFLCALGVNHQIRGNYDDAYTLYEKVLAVDPSNLKARSSQLLLLNYSAKYSQQEVFDAHRQFEQSLSGSISKSKQFKASKVIRSPKQKIRIGYVSADFRVHSVAYFFETLLANHNKDKFEIYCYYNNNVKDEFTSRLKSLSDHWRDVAELSDMNLADNIHKDKIDILVDLSGYTSGHRLATFLYRPAPIQVSWLGYPNTTGLSCMDYRITDQYADPEGQGDEYYTETLLRASSSFLCYQGDTDLPYQPKPPYEDNGYITFGSFNNLTKITDEVLKTWAQILNSLPNAKLLMKCKQLAAEKAQQRILKLFEEQGVSKDRVTFKAKIKNYQEHMQLYNEIDIGLDPFPYNGTTTTFEALWMGVPTLTLKGDRHAGRVGTSIMSNAGLTNFVCQDAEDYIHKAKEMASNPDCLSAIRKDMRQQMMQSSLCDSAAFATDIEDLYQQMLDLQQVNNY